MEERPFRGFHAGEPACVVPSSFFTAVLPGIADPAELVVSVYLFFALGRRRGSPRAVTRRSLAGERPLLRALARLPGGAEAALREGLARSVARGLLLTATSEETDEPIYLLNTDAARRMLAEGATIVAAEAEAGEGEAVAATPSNVYTLYEENIGSLSPLLVDELAEAEQRYPQPWIEAAFREAVANNRRNWRYIARILERWKVEGPDYATPGRRAPFKPEGGRRTVGGPYRRVVERGGQGRRRG